MAPRKRARAEMEASAPPPAPPKEPTTLEKLRNMWEFANLAQYIFLFGEAVKIDESMDIEELEMECLRPDVSTKLIDLGLALLKFVSSHRGLTPALFDEYTRRQFMARLPAQNPFGEEEEPNKFANFDVFIKVRTLYQLSQWTMIHADRIREKMKDMKDYDQTGWRMDPIGWDESERTYFVLDDNRLYRRTDPPPPPPPRPKVKANSKKGKAAARANKRRKLSAHADATQAEEEDEASAHVVENDGLGGMKWECVAVSLEDYHAYLAANRRSKDSNQIILNKNLTDDVIPIIEEQVERHKRKAAQKEKDLQNLQKLATAKRSSRIAGKKEKEREELEIAAAAQKRVLDLEMAKKQQAKMKKMEAERDTRVMTREQRLKDRDSRRILAEEELETLSKTTENIENGDEARISERHRKAEIEKRMKQLEELAQESEWFFDCSVCHVYGDNIDDGTHSVACEKCNVWQHSECLGINKEDAGRDDFHFICQTCVQRAADAERAAKSPKIMLKIRRPRSQETSLPTSDLGTNAIIEAVNGKADGVEGAIVNGTTNGHTNGYSENTGSCLETSTALSTTNDTPEGIPNGTTNGIITSVPKVNGVEVEPQSTFIPYIYPTPSKTQPI
ncbi:MAG: hypothetical protein M1829_002605 [Trizodia sp. TS-e1964]|nr:MAG: hypothetical protein M1829_002605 [Trizodia sp. TS-e1964]